MSTKRDAYTSNPTPRKEAERQRYASKPSPKREAERKMYASKPSPKRGRSMLLIFHLKRKHQEYIISLILLP